jgi:hypothetical protein
LALEQPARLELGSLRARLAPWLGVAVIGRRAKAYRSTGATKIEAARAYSGHREELTAISIRPADWTE